MARDLDLSLLRTFVAVAEARNFSRGAERLQINQSVVSERIKRLEDVLGVRVMQRSRQGVTLTEAGTALLSEASPLLLRSEQMAHRVREISSGRQASIQIACTHWAMFDVAPRVLSIIRREAPDLNVSLVHLSTGEQLQALGERTIDVGLMRGGAFNDDLVRHELLRQPIMVAMPSDDTLTKKRKLHWRDLKGRPLVLTRRQFDPATYSSILQRCLEAGFTPQVFDKEVRFQTLLTHVAAGVGLALVPRTENFHHNEIEMRGVSNGLEVTYVFVTAPGEDRASVARMISTVQAHV